VDRRLAGDGVNAQDSSPFSSPMVIISYQPVVSLLRALGVVTQASGFLIFDVSAYLHVVSAGTRWTAIAGNGAYRSVNRVLLSTTDPRYSNSGGMFAAIAYSAQDGNDPFNGVKPGDRYLTVIRECFAGQGSMDTHTPDLLTQFLTDGMGREPMAMVYESDYIHAKLTDQAYLPPGLEVLYPTPDVIPDNTFVSWTSAGNKMTGLLARDPVLAVLAERHGYRTSQDAVRFVREMADKGITVPGLGPLPAGLQIAALPAAASFQELIDAVTPG
jgi:hypothetical protein